MKVNINYAESNGRFFVRYGNLFRFDGKLAVKKNYRDWADWYEIEKVPCNVEKIIPTSRTLVRYDLKEEHRKLGIATSVQPDFFKYIDEDNSYIRENQEFFLLYDAVYEDIPETYKTVDVEWKKITARNLTVLNTVTKWSEIDGIIYNFVDVMDYDKTELQSRPCEIPARKWYSIIRKYIQENIDPKVAVITSDYDFCLSVQKRIPLAEQEEYTVDVNNPFFGRKKRVPKYEKRYRTERKSTVYEICPPDEHGQPYQKYPLCQPLQASNWNELYDKANEYLENTMKMINQPLVDCPHCKGCGVILSNKN